MSITKFLHRYFINIIIALDELINTIFLGSPHETISSRVGRNYPNSWIYKLINLIIFWEPNHCKKHIEPKDYENGALRK